MRRSQYAALALLLCICSPSAGAATPVKKAWLKIKNANQGDLPRESMTRYPSLRSAGGLLRSLDYLGTVAFATGGAICAGRAGMDLLGCIEIGVITAMGGGTTRDLLLGQTPVFWLQEVEYLAMCIVTSIATFYAWPHIRHMPILSASGSSDDGALPRWLDTIGLGAFAVVGTQHGIRRRLHPLATVVIATITCSFGGVTRDVMTKAPIRVMHSHAELYATTAAAGSCAYLIARAAVADPLLRMAAGFGVTVAARFAAWTLDLRLPTLKA
eukprot:TRINITY_DN1377_c0_g1_i1.p1 TRINITY_DN1377_c0_g1~~TRINITY_DN1377_c0_g1_i1.p1  ORF type:complete len:270 (-),score=67.37 TRINITY_DN1377_c0_g1_i1:797-1606(-)